MGFCDMMKKVIGIEEIEDEITQEEIENEKNKILEQRKDDFSYKKIDNRNNKSFSFNTSSFRLIIIEPDGFDDCPKLADKLIGGQSIIVNLEKVETDIAKKIFDFLSGATYALNGKIQRVTNNIFIFCPKSVDVVSNIERKTL